MDEDIIPSSIVETKIRAIARDTVHKICSGQVVLSLGIAVKELVENSIDAGASIINIHLKEYGSEAIEVSDNGIGVEEENFQALTLKHHTSKITAFEDLAGLETLGFRGEALSSLCALSDLEVVTKHSTVDLGTRITYDRNGRIASTAITPRETGTTVTLRNLFSTLPVRRKEFEKNLKREFNKMCQLLYSYCLVSKGIKFSCTNTTVKGARNNVVNTEGLHTVKENIISIFGSKQIGSLIEIDLVSPLDDDLKSYNIEAPESIPFTIEFFISSASHGSGRSASDRQFFYVNSRPCDPSKLAKLINETYRQYNNKQYPFVYLNITTKSSLVDINVTPDKRQVFLEKEKLLLAIIKSSLTEGFKHFPSTYSVQNLEQSQNSTIADFFETKSVKRSLSERGVDRKNDSFMLRFQKRSRTEGDRPRRKISESSDEEEETDTIICLTKTPERISAVPKPRGNKIKSTLERFMKTNVKQKIADQLENAHNIIEDNTGTIHKLEQTTNDRLEDNDSIKEDSFLSDCKEETLPDSESEESSQVKLIMEQNIKCAKQNIKTDKDMRQKNLHNRRTITLNVSIDTIKKQLQPKILEKNKDKRIRFRSEIAPDSNKSAEEELQKHISKEDFAQMEVIGQFNLGFIVTKLHSDLFLIDQHATDEKYNFEHLQNTTVLENQVLVRPKLLELTAGNENLLIENQEIFRKNGFQFKIDETAPCTKKVSLTSVPLSKNIIFGKDDIDEMLFMLKDYNRMVRPTRVRSMLASRACRKSVMIGKPLSRPEMRKLIDHMGEIEQPWNCPHGRPTMRHLINLGLIQYK